MPREKFSDDCPGCRPVMFNVKTGELLTDSDPGVKAMMRVWKTTTRNEREAFHRATCLNDKDPLILAAVASLLRRVEKAAAEN